jgi:PAS domain S-box-containing protein
MMNNVTSHILIVDGNPDDRARLRRMLESLPDQPRVVWEAETAASALAMIHNSELAPFDCLVVGERLPDMNAKEVLAALCGQSGHPPCAVIILTDSRMGASQGVLRAGAQDCLIRDQLTPETLNRAVINAIERYFLSAEHLQAREALRESDARFRSLLEAAPDAMVIVDQHGIIVLVNSLTKHMFGYTADELPGRHVEMLMPARMRGSLNELQLSCMTDPEAPEGNKGVELMGLRKDGSQFPVEVTLSPLETTQGVLMSMAVRDVTIRRQVEDRLKHSNAQLRFIMESMPQKISTAQPNGSIDYFNPQCTEFTGLSFDELMGWGWTAIIHPDDVDEHVRVWRKSIQTGEMFEFESRFRRFDGEYRWHFSRALPMRDSAGKIVMWVGSNTDIHDIKLAEAAMQISEVRYRRLFEAAKDGILILDFTSGRIVDCNPFMSDLLGYSYQSFLGKELWEIGLFRDRAANVAAVETLQKLGYLRYEHLPLESKDGRAVEVEVVANAYHEANQKVIQCNIRDITERSRLEKLLQSQAQELENLHLRKDEFLAMLSHELRSPLAPIANAVQLMSLQKDTESRVQHQARNIIERQLGKLQHLVDDLLEVSRITSGRLQLRQERVTVNSIAQGAVETVRPLIQQKHHELTVSLPAAPLWLYADPARLEQVVVNLLTNSAKYTEEGGHLWLTVAAEGNECVIRVRDTGVGIAPNLLPHIFDLFTQADRSLDRSQGGLGIGLALVQRLTELHDGKVEVHSEPGQGSEFVVRLPLHHDDASDATEAHPDVHATTRPLRVLVVDDSEDTVLGFTLLLNAHGHEVRSAYDGLEVAGIAAEFRPDVIILDIGLPGLNGYQVAKQVRELPFGRDIVLIALTGYGRNSDRQSSAVAGFDHHLVKPAKFDQLMQILNEVKT